MRVLMISDRSIFGEGLCSLLQRQSDFDVMGHMAEAEDTPGYIELLRPDVLIVDCPDKESDPSPVLMRCLNEGWVQKICMVSRHDNSIRVITSQRRVVDEVGSLVEAIKESVSGPGSSRDVRTQRGRCQAGEDGQDVPGRRGKPPDDNHGEQR